MVTIVHNMVMVLMIVVNSKNKNGMIGIMATIKTVVSIITTAS